MSCWSIRWHPPMGLDAAGEPDAGDRPYSAFLYLPHSIYIGTHGLPHFEAAMAAQHALTQRFTAEFCIRPYLLHHPQATLARLRDWAQDDNAHVRRLVSEGTRPRLPWAPRLPAFQNNPQPGPSVSRCAQGTTIVLRAPLRGQPPGRHRPRPPRPGRGHRPHLAARRIPPRVKPWCATPALSPQTRRRRCASTPWAWAMSCCAGCAGRAPSARPRADWRQGGIEVELHNPTPQPQRVLAD